VGATCAAKWCHLSHVEANIFVIDDDESIRVSLSRLLRSAGFKCMAFSSAEEFLGGLPPDANGCAIIDVHMPGMNGVELMHVLRGSALKVTVILMTAFDDADARKQAAGADVVMLRKPFDDSMLLCAINQVCKPAPGGVNGVQ